MTHRFGWVVAGVLLANGCNPSGTSSTGVGNPGAIALELVNDDEPEPSSTPETSSGTQGSSASESRSVEAGAAGTSQQQSNGHPAYGGDSSGASSESDSNGGSTGGDASSAGASDADADANAGGASAGAADANSSAGAAGADSRADDSTAGAAGTSSSGSNSNGGSSDGNAGTSGSSAGGASSGGASEGADERLPAGSVHHAILVLGELRWLPCDGSPPSVVPGPFVLDLVRRETSPAVPPVVPPAGGFCGIDAPLAPATAPAALAGRSLFFDGVRADGTLFLVYADMQATLQLRAPAGVSWNSTQTPTLLWAFRPRRWLNRKEVDEADSMPWDGGARAIVIDVDRHPVLYGAIRNRLAGRSTLYGDLNSNGSIDPSDRELVLGTGSTTD